MTIAGEVSARFIETAFGLDWPAPFFAYQSAGIEALLEADALLLADEMGLGKTVQAVAALRILVRRRTLDNCLIVCPLSVVVQWRRELRVWAPDVSTSTVIGSADQRTSAWNREASVYITTYDSLCHDAGVPWRRAPSRRVWDLVIIDEAQRIKNPKADASRIVKCLQRQRSWALTGTPLENSLDDLISVLDFVAPGRFDPRGMWVGLSRLLDEVRIRRRRREVLHELPPKFVSTVRLELTAQQRAAYRRAEEEGVVRLRTLGAELRISHVLELILRLKQICNFCPNSNGSAKLADLRIRLDALSESGEKALVFSQFVAEPFGAERLAGELAPFQPLLLTGSLEKEARAAVIQDFAADSSRRLLIVSLRAGGLGLNLTAASAVFHFDRWWNPALETQAEDRVHRIGQRRPVQIFAYLCNDTVEERIDQILTEKRRLFANIIDGVATAALDRLDLEGLVRAAVPNFRR
ncbi:MAG: DEAD/DEAH box helicase [Acetobacteraceae bacterium]